MPRAARSQAATTEQQATAEARANVEDLVRQSGGSAAIAFRSLDGSRELFIDADKPFPATSQWVEIPVMIELYAQVQARALRMDDLLTVHNSFRSADGSEYRLDAGRDPDRELYRETGRRVSIGELNSRMMKQNSQLAANLLMERFGLGSINARLAALNANGVVLRCMFQDPAARKLKRQNTASTRAMMQILWLLATDQAVSAAASKEMVGLIANARTAASGAFAANPNGSATGEAYQAAVIVYGARSFALAVAIEGLKSGEANAALIAKISHALAAAN